MNMNSSRRGGNCGAGMNAPRFLRRLFGIAGMMLAAAWIAPAHAITPAGPPMVELVPSSGYFGIYWADPVNLGDPPAREYRVRYRIAGHANWHTPGGEDGAAYDTPLDSTSFCGSAHRYRAVNEPFLNYGGALLILGGFPTCYVEDPDDGFTYEVQMAYFNGEIGEWSPPQFVTTSTPWRPLSPMIMRGASGFKIEWTAGHVTYNTFNKWVVRVKSDPTTGHKVRWRREGESAYTESIPLAANARA
ncbi:MAG: hypothetical protein OD918_11720, partial [Gammaproteobacteria bacterium]